MFVCLAIAAQDRVLSPARASAALEWLWVNRPRYLARFCQCRYSDIRKLFLGLSEEALQMCVMVTGTIVEVEGPRPLTDQVLR